MSLPHSGGPPVGKKWGSPVVLAFFALVAIVIALGVGWVILQNLPILIAYQLGAPAYFILLIIISLAVAIVLFGILRATGSLTGKHFGYTVEFGGAAAIFAFILLYGIWIFPSTPTDFSLTFRFRPEDHRTIAEAFGEPSVKRATVTLYLPKQTLRKDLTADGYATIDNIPGRYRPNPIELDLSSDVFVIKDQLPSYIIPSGTEPLLPFIVVPVRVGKTKPDEVAVIPKTSRVLVIKPAVARITSGGTSDGHSPFCQRRTVQQCVTPERGGHLVPGTGSVTNEVRVGRAGWTVTKDTPEQICIELWAATGACETEVSVQGQASAVEEYVTQ
ncbi:hypothetical protein [Bradyrhizobium sp. RT3a]|uniref:hypothetical protein n=1 Tax=Bradyrhizobium sp. RT3a TaxID=3156333 RepID=UPI003396A768